jgi:hypothetical protein
MSLTWKIALIASLLIPAPQTAGFTSDERQIINNYYRHVISTLAPGSIDRKPLSIAMEEALKIGARLPIMLEKKAARLPEKLESQLPLHGADFKRYRVGNHVVLVKTPEWTIVDIIRGAGMK